MASINKDTENVEEIKTTDDWESYVRNEVNIMLDLFLPYSVNGNIGIVYKKLLIEETEAGPVYDDSKVVGVEVVLDFNFDQPISLSDE